METWSGLRGICGESGICLRAADIVLCGFGAVQVALLPLRCTREPLRCARKEEVVAVRHVVVEHVLVDPDLCEMVRRCPLHHRLNGRGRLVDRVHVVDGARNIELWWVLGLQR